MSNAFVIEVFNQTAGIVVAEDRGFRFFSSKRAFDPLEGGHFGSARAAERAAKALVEQGNGARRARPAAT
ncbi:MAG: hypothetical protein ABWY18_10640 [Tardiphaga sp.]